MTEDWQARALAAEAELTDPIEGLPGMLIDLCRGWADGLNPLPIEDGETR